MMRRRLDPNTEPMTIPATAPFDRPASEEEEEDEGMRSGLTLPTLQTGPVELPLLVEGVEIVGPMPPVLAVLVLVIETDELLTVIIGGDVGVLDCTVQPKAAKATAAQAPPPLGSTEGQA